MTEAMDALADRIRATPLTGPRRLVALAGPPASGKSTLATRLAAKIDASCVIPMDGFHLDNRLLDDRGQRQQKGAPQTFDAAGFVHLVHRLKDEDEVVFPLFDRETDCAIAGAGCVTARTTTAIVEGNYLLLDAPPWRDLSACWDLSLFLAVDDDTLERRLIDRWLGYGFSPEDARTKAEANDLPNARLVRDRSRPADITLTPADL
jgi:pantothenate kinase